jgi:hypothetical protein
MGHARAILMAKNPEELAQQIIEAGLSVRQAEERAKGQVAAAAPLPVAAPDIIRVHPPLREVASAPAKRESGGCAAAGEYARRIAGVAGQYRHARRPDGRGDYQLRFADPARRNSASPAAGLALAPPSIGGSSKLRRMLICLALNAAAVRVRVYACCGAANNRFAGPIFHHFAALEHQHLMGHGLHG